MSNVTFRRHRGAAGLIHVEALEDGFTLVGAADLPSYEAVRAWEAGIFASYGLDVGTLYARGIRRVPGAALTI